MLDQWEDWFTAMDQEPHCIYLFIYDDNARHLGHRRQVGEAERQFMQDW